MTWRLLKTLYVIFLDNIPLTSKTDLDWIHVLYFTSLLLNDYLVIHTHRILFKQQNWILDLIHMAPGI